PPRDWATIQEEHVHLDRRLALLQKERDEPAREDRDHLLRRSGPPGPVSAGRGEPSGRRVAPIRGSNHVDARAHHRARARFDAGIRACARTGVCATAVARVAVGSHTRMRATFHAGAHDSAPTPLSRPQSGPPPAVSSEEERREEGEEEEGDPQAVHRSSSLLPWTRRIVSCRAPPCPIPSQWPAARASGPPAV